MTIPQSLGPIEAVKTIVVQSLRTTFSTANFPESYLQEINVDIEYPAQVVDYPSIWVGFSFTINQSAGIGMEEVTEENIPYQTWRYQGVVSLRIFSLTSLERDRMSDSLINFFAFGSLDPVASTFQTQLATSDLINITPITDVLESVGQTESVGTPWDDNLVVYQDAYSFNVVGEYFSTYQSGVFALLESFKVTSANPTQMGQESVSVVESDNSEGTWEPVWGPSL